jgi:hypothetical protein
MGFVVILQAFFVPVKGVGIVIFSFVDGAEL